MMPSTVGAQQQDAIYRSKADIDDVSMPSINVPSLISAVLAGHPSVRGSRYDSEAADKLVDVAKRQFYPTPSVSMESGDHRPTTVFRLTQPIWTGGQLTGRLHIAELRRERAALVADEVRTKLALRVLELCQSYVNNTHRIKTMAWTAHTLEQLTAMIGRRAEAEVSSLADRRVAEARLAQARADLQGYLAARKQAQDQLAQLNGTPVNMEALAWLAPSEGLRPLPDYLAAAIADWPSNRVARVDEFIAKRDAEVAKAAQWPTLSLSFEHRNGIAPGVLYDNNRVLLLAQYTLGAGLSAVPQAEAAQSLAYSAEQAKETAERLSTDSIVVEWQAFQSASSRRLAQADAYQGAQDILASNRRLFVAGRRSWIDVVNSVREASQAEIAQGEIETVLVASHFRLELLAGRQIWMSSVAQ